MACVAVLYSTIAALMFCISLVAFGDPSALQVTLGYFAVGKMAFWMTILRLSVQRSTAR